MRVVLNKVGRHIYSALTFWMPPEKRIANERRLRGKEEFRKLGLADCVIVSFGKSGPNPRCNSRLPRPHRYLKAAGSDTANSTTR